jgi:LPS export ABC transporter permease LptG
VRTLDRYLIRGFLYPFLYCLVLFTVLFVVVDVFENLDEFLRNAVPAKVVLSYYFYLLPVILTNIVPVSILVSILYKLGNLNRHNEIVALKASGVSTLHILLPYLFMGILISFSLFLVSETVLPEAMLTSTSIKQGLIEKGRKNLGERAIRNVALYGAGKKMIFARELEVTSKTLYDIIVLQDGPDQSVQWKMTAKKGKYEDGKWTFYDAMRYRMDPRGELAGEPEFFDRLDPGLEEKPEDFIKGASQIEFMSARQLRDYIGHLKGGSRQMVRRMTVDLHSKIAFPFVSFVVMLIGAPLAMRTERGSAMVGIGTSLVVVVLYYAVNSVCLALGKGGHLEPVVSAWFSNALFAAIGIFLIKNAA